jgi:mRNA interferase HigB
LFPIWEHASLPPVRIVARRALRDFWRRYPDAEQALKTWHKEASRAIWSSPQDVKLAYRHASFIGANRVVFKIAGNKYRLIVKFNYAYGIGYVRFIGTHAAYDRIDAETV